MSAGSEEERGSRRLRVVRLAAYRSRGVVAVLKDLLKLAEVGDVQGLTFVAKFGPGDHRAGIAGDYRRSPEEAMSATFKLERALRQDMPEFGTTGL